MTNLPYSQHLPIHHLAASFDNVTNSYKFYWLLGILEYLQTHQERTIPITNLLARMISNVWYPINYFNLSFGKQDRLAFITYRVKNETTLKIDSDKKSVFKEVLNHLSHIFDTEIKEQVNSLSRFVPFRFLSPWFSSELRGKKDHIKNTLIEALAEDSFLNPSNPCLYRFVRKDEDYIEIQPEWYEYLQQHHSILTGFCLWHLVNYLQKHNPNVPNIAGKLFEPEQRNLIIAKKFWELVFDDVGTIACIYSDLTMNKKGFSLDHFIPWRFVTHDLLWNIIPTPKHVNSSKSDCLPDMNIYFERFSHLQQQAVRIVANSNKATLLEDYTILFQKDNFREISQLSFEEFSNVIYNTIAPQIQLAKNMGFAADWTYRNA